RSTSRPAASRTAVMWSAHSCSACASSGCSWTNVWVASAASRRDSTASLIRASSIGSTLEPRRHPARPWHPGPAPGNRRRDATPGSHRDQIQATELPESVGGGGDCPRAGGKWLHLRICLACGHVGCCDDSPARHATAHAHATSHPIIRSLEPGEDWCWCYV